MNCLRMFTRYHRLIWNLTLQEPVRSAPVELIRLAKTPNRYGNVGHHTKSGKIRRRRIKYWYPPNRASSASPPKAPKLHKFGKWL